MSTYCRVSHGYFNKQLIEIMSMLGIFSMQVQHTLIVLPTKQHQSLRINHGSAAEHFFISTNKISASRRYFVLAEMGGFEPPVELPLRHISSVLPSTAQPHLHQTIHKI